MAKICLNLSNFIEFNIILLNSKKKTGISANKSYVKCIIQKTQLYCLWMAQPHMCRTLHLNCNLCAFNIYEKEKNRLNRFLPIFCTSSLEKLKKSPLTYLSIWKADIPHDYFSRLFLQLVKKSKLQRYAFGPCDIPLLFQPYETFLGIIILCGLKVSDMIDIKV